VLYPNYFLLFLFLPFPQCFLKPSVAFSCSSTLGLVLFYSISWRLMGLLLFSSYTLNLPTGDYGADITWLSLKLYTLDGLRWILLTGESRNSSNLDYVFDTLLGDLRGDSNLHPLTIDSFLVSCNYSLIESDSCDSSFKIFFGSFMPYICLGPIVRWTC